MITRKYRKLLAVLEHIQTVEGASLERRKRPLRVYRRARWKLLGGNRPTWSDYNVE